MNFQEMIAALTQFWAAQGCAVHQGYDLEVGAGTFNPATFLRCLGPEPYRAVYVEPSRRPKDGRYGENPNRVQFYHQMQVILKPSPENLQELYLQSLESIGLKLQEHDIRFVHDDWENPTIGAWGLGWEVWSDGMEVTQFTYFQAIGGVPVNPVSGELTYGLERLAMYIQGVDSIFDLKWNDTLLYGEIYKRNEWEWSHYNFHEADTHLWLRHFSDFEQESKRLIQKHLPIPAYDFVMKASHAFNILDARGALSVTERARYIGRIRNLAKQLADCYVKSRESQAFPLLAKGVKKEEPIRCAAVSTQGDPEEREDFLLEIGSEELPATFVPIGMRGLEHGMRSFLESEGFKYEKLHVFGTPRRLSVLVTGLVGATAAHHKERKGPSVSAAFDATGKPTAVGEGFFRSLGLAPSLQQPGIEVKEGYIVAMLQIVGKKTRAHLAAFIPKLILALDFPKKMRWGDSDIEYARPLRWIVALYGSEVIPCTVGSIVSGKQSMGHRQLANISFEIPHAASYVECLRKHYVLADVEERRSLILQGLKEGVLAHERVLPQVTHLVEYPFVIEGHFDPAFLSAPKEVLISEMVEHQKYFPMAEASGELKPTFMIVSNNRPTELIRSGHEKALSPRLADGVFLYEEDLKVPLEHFNEQLKKMTYQQELGSLSAKVGRLMAYVTLLHRDAPITSLEKASRTALLCKADLASGLVGEFPELQGVVGKLYALKHGEDPEVAQGIDDHWMPRGEHAQLPQSPSGILVSIAEKMDNLISCFALNLKPTSSSDPHALRRQALGLIKILIEQKLHLPLKSLFLATFDLFLKNPEIDSTIASRIAAQKESLVDEIMTFLMSRLRTVLSDYGFEKDEIEAVLVFDLQSVYDLYRRLEALHTFRKKQEFQAILEVQTRTKKILLSQKVGRFPDVMQELLQQPCEQQLFAQLQKIKASFHHTLLDQRDFEHRQYPEAFSLLTELQQPLHLLFDEVKVLDEDERLRTNRLALLQEVYDLCEELADLSKLSRGE